MLSLSSFHLSRLYFHHSQSEKNQREKVIFNIKLNHASYMFDEMFERNPLLISSSQCCCSCCCCFSAANISMRNRLTLVSPNFLCKGLTQSTLIQWSLTKRLIFHGSSRGFYSNTPGVSSFIDRNYYHEKLSSFNEKRKQRQRGFGRKRKKQLLGNVSDDYVNDVEVMLSLFTDESDSKKIDKKHFICNNKEKKNVDSRVVKKDRRCDEKQEKILEKKDTVKGYYGELVGGSQDWRKKSEKQLIEVDEVTDQSGSRMKCKQFEELLDKDNNVIDLNFSSQKLKVISEVKKTEKIDLSGTSLLSESRMKNFEDNSTKVVKEEKHKKTDDLIKITTISSEKSQKRSRILDTHVTNSENSSFSHGKSDKVTGTEYDHLNLDMKMVESTTNGPKGPSDEMWLVTDTSDDTSSSNENDDVIKNSDKSLLTIIGDVFRFRWSSPCSESHIPNSSGGKCSSWCSSHELNDSNINSVACNPESPIPFPTTKKSRQVSLSDSKNGELKKRKVKVKDKFDEWEEAFGIEDKKRKEDEIFMREAILEAKKAADVFEVPVGAVLVHNGKIIARGYNLVEELRDSTAHAEMICIRKASKNFESWRLLDTTLYVTLEPCPMCAGAILQARIDTLVWGAPNKLLGADGSWIRLFSNRNDGKDDTLTDKPPAPVHPFHQNMSVRRGILAEECAGIMKQFFRSRRHKKTKSESLIPSESESPIPSELELIPTSSTTVSHNHSSFLSTMQHAFKIIFCL